MTNYKAIQQASQLDADVNLITRTRSGKRQVRETDGRLVRTKFNLNQTSREAAWEAEKERQIAEYGMVLFA